MTTRTESREQARVRFALEDEFQVYVQGRYRDLISLLYALRAKGSAGITLTESQAQALREASRARRRLRVAVPAFCEPVEGRWRCPRCGRLSTLWEPVRGPLGAVVAIRTCEDCIARVAGRLWDVGPKQGPREGRAR